GAMATHDRVATASEVGSAIPGLARVAAGIGDPHVRNRGTIGGPPAHNDPAPDQPPPPPGPAPTTRPKNPEVAARQFVTGLFSPALREGEIIPRVSFPVPGKFAYLKFPNPASRYALVGVAVAQTGKEARVAVTGAGSNGVFRHKQMEAALAKNWSPEA